MKSNLITFIQAVVMSSSKKFLLETKQKFEDKKIAMNSQNDYMADVEIQSVDAGEPVELKCVSPTEFSGCFFSKTDEKLIYRIESNSSFKNGRLTCLCDHDKSIDPKKVCGLLITEAKKEDAGEWRCEVEINRNNLVQKISAMMTLNVNGNDSTDTVKHQIKPLPDEPLIVTPPPLNTTLVHVPPPPPLLPTRKHTCMKEGMNYNGTAAWNPSNGGYKNVKSIEDCQQKCKANGWCTYWSYHWKDKRCYGRDYTAKVKETYDATFDSGKWNCEPIPACVLENAIIVGHTVWHTKFKPSKTMSDCQKTCYGSRTCKFWVYSRKERKCYEKANSKGDGYYNSAEYESAYWSCVE